MGGAAVSQQEGNGHGEGHDGEGDVGGRIAKIAHFLTDEDLVNDIIEGIDQEGDDRGDGEPGDELPDFFRPQGMGDFVLCFDLFHKSMSTPL